jgi:shikimate kinase
MESNITLIGMPGAGKSTIGIVLAKYMAYGFIDTDVLIQINHRKTLQDLIDENGYLHLREIEEGEILKINIEKHIIATGGSVIYSDEAMRHLQNISTIVFLNVSYDVMMQRIHNFDTRGIAKAQSQTYEELFRERQVLYEKYAGITIDCDRHDHEQLAEELMVIIKERKGR